MWYFSWILGIGVALAFGEINVMWLESRRESPSPSPSPSPVRKDGQK